MADSSTLLKGSPLLESNIRVTASVNGAKSTEWDSASGGDVTVAMSTVRVGSEPRKRSVISGVPDAAPVTITKKMVMPDVWALQAYLQTQIGIGTVKVWKTPMDTLGTADYGHASNVVSLVYEGIISSAPTVNAANESSSVATISVTLMGSGWKPSA